MGRSLRRREMYLGTSERNRLRGLSAVNDPASSAGITRGESLIKFRPINHFISKAAIRVARYCGIARIRGSFYGKPLRLKSHHLVSPIALEERSTPRRY